VATRGDSGTVGPEAFLGTSLRKRIQNCEYKIRYEIEYLFRTRKQITTNLKFKKVVKCHKHH
jgi:hypothetical protein